MALERQHLIKFIIKVSPPEVLSEHPPFTKQYDIYLAGLTIYRLLNGNEHFSVQKNLDINQYKADILNGKFPNREDYLYHVPQKLKKAVNKALNVSPSDRYPNVLEFINELSNIDENLDWEYSKAPNTQKWTMDQGNKTLTINVVSNGNIHQIETFKQMKSNGNVSKVKDHCHKNLNTKNLKPKVQKALRECQ